MSTRAQAHGNLWYDSARYRLAWLVLPQAAVAVAASLVMWLGGGQGQGNWGNPAGSAGSSGGSDSGDAKYAALLDRAGKNGDRAAFDELSKQAAAGDTAAQFYLAPLYDPVWASLYPARPVGNDVAKALQLYQPTADLGFAGGQRAMTLLSLNTVYGQYDIKRGCKYGDALVKNPAASVHTENQYAALFLTAICYVDDASGLPRDPDKAADLYMTTVAAKYHQAVAAVTGNYTKMPTDLIAAVQRNLKTRGLYNGATDGAPSPDTLAALNALAGQGQSPDSNQGAATPQPAENGATGQSSGDAGAPPTERLTGDALKALFQDAATNAASAEKLRGYADGGDGRAQVYYAALFSPNYKMERNFPTDAHRAATYYERLAADGNGPAATSAAYLYDVGYPELPRNPDKAAALALRALDLKDADMDNALDKETWGAGFWAALQQQLARRNMYSGDIVDRKNDRTMLAVHQLAGVQQ